MRTAIAALSALAAVAAAPQAAAQAEPAQPIAAAANENPWLTVAADGEVIVTPDAANLSVGVSSRGDTAAAALGENAKVMTKVLAALRKLNVAESDIRTNSVMVNQEYAYPENEPARLTGYMANNDVSIRVRDLKRLGQIIDAVATAGSTNIGGVFFDVSDPKKHLDAARAKAVKEARARAEIYAEAAGMKLGRLYSIQDYGSTAPAPVPLMAAARAEADAAPVTPMQPGEMTLTASVTVTYELK